MENLGNLAQSTLHTTVIAGDLAWVVDNPSSGPSFPAANFRVRVGTALTGEIVLVTTVQASTPVAGQQTWTVTRGAENTTSQGWPAGTIIQHVLTKSGLDGYLPRAPKWTPTSKTANYSANPGEFVLGDTTGGAFVVTLPDATTCTGQAVQVKKTSTDGNQLQVATTASQTIDGSLTQEWTDPKTTLTVVSDGSNWQIV